MVKFREGKEVLAPEKRLIMAAGGATAREDLKPKVFEGSLRGIFFNFQKVPLRVFHVEHPLG